MAAGVTFVRQAIAVALTAALAACAPSSNASNPSKAAGSGLLPSGKWLHAPTAISTNPITHIMIVVQENRTVDNLFQGLRGADTASSGLNSFGQTVPLHAVPLAVPYDFIHAHQAFVTEYDGGKMDGFNREREGPQCSATNCAYAYVRRSDVIPYFEMAHEYVFGDRMFQSNQGPSFPAHQYLVSGDAAGLPATSDDAAENPSNLRTGKSHGGGGCDSPHNERVKTIDRHGVEGNPVYPCFERPVLTDLLDTAGVGWRYYQTGGGSGLWHAFDAIQHVRYGRDYANVVTDSEAALSDIAAGNLAQVTWIMPGNGFSDHPGGSLDREGPQWVAAIVNAIGASRYWKSTAIFVTWDDWGGWYDHVKPPIYTSNELGFRVPLLVISPYAKRGRVSHVQYEFGSILKFVEKTFGLGSLGTTDKRASGMMDCFDFHQPPRAFVRIKAAPFIPPEGAAAALEDP
jgi:phospholipase C